MPPIRKHRTGPLVTLDHGDWHLVLAPEFGGRIVSLRHSTRDVMRPTNSIAMEQALPYGFAGFPLVPLSGPSFGKGFFWGDLFVSLARNVAEEPTYTHGDGWVHGWDTIAAKENEIQLQHRHLPHEGEWPWRYRAELGYRLTGSGLQISLAIENADSTPMPAGLGFHPYFPRPPGTTLAFRAVSVWPPDAPDALHQTPGSLGALDFSSGLDICETRVDRCFEEWDRSAELCWPDGTKLVMTASESFPRLQLYSPIDYDFACVEPVSNANDALNRMAADPTAPHGIKVLMPGERMDGWIFLELDRSAQQGQS